MLKQKQSSPIEDSQKGNDRFRKIKTISQQNPRNGFVFTYINKKGLIKKLCNNRRNRGGFARNPER